MSEGYVISPDFDDDAGMLTLSAQKTYFQRARYAMKFATVSTDERRRHVRTWLSCRPPVLSVAVGWGTPAWLRGRGTRVRRNKISPLGDEWRHRC